MTVFTYKTAGFLLESVVFWWYYHITNQTATQVETQSRSFSAEREGSWNMFKIMKMPNADRFIQVVDQSSGQVWLCLSDGVRCDLKQDPAARQLFRMACPGPEGLCLSLSDNRDLSAFVRCLIG